MEVVFKPFEAVVGLGELHHPVGCREAEPKGRGRAAAAGAGPAGEHRGHPEPAAAPRRGARRGLAGDLERHEGGKSDEKQGKSVVFSCFFHVFHLFL